MNLKDAALQSLVQPWLWAGLAVIAIVTVLLVAGNRIRYRGGRRR